MNKNEESKTIYQILNNIQKKLKAPKDLRNNFGKYNYRSCEQILEAVKPLLEGAILTITDEVVMIGDRYYIKAVARLMSTDIGETVTAVAYAREAESKKGMDPAQVTGATSSYARKYALNGLFCIDDNKDPDATNEHKEEKDDLLVTVNKMIKILAGSDVKAQKAVWAQLGVMKKEDINQASDETKKEWITYLKERSNG